MTQKRFKKLLMSKGYDRNQANAIVKTTIQSGKPYAKAIEFYNLSIRVSCSTEAFTNALKQLQKVAESVTNAVRAFGKTFYDTMGKGDDITWRNLI